jgi:predicted phosphodiesterase
MTRLAVLSDVHGNLPALEAVLADVAAQGAPDVTWVLGDLVAFCPWPVETLARLRELPQAALLQGNTDRYLVTGRRPAAFVRSPDDWANMPITLSERDANFRWTVERLSYADYEFLSGLPASLEMDLPGYGRVVAVHANPRDDETNILPDTPGDRVRPLLRGLDARLMLYGHTHRPVDRVVDGVRLVNDGSVGIPLDGDPRACYALLDFAADRCSVTLRRVPYDVGAVVAELDRLEHPGRRFVGGLLSRAAPAGA